MDFSKEELKKLALGYPVSGYTRIEMNKLIDTEIGKQYEMIFQYNNSYYKTICLIGALPYDEEIGDVISCIEVIPEQKNITFYNEA